MHAGARAGGLQRWAVVALIVGAISLSCSLAGLVWDVAWHIDLGRDRRLLTPAHLMTLAGLAGFGLAGALGVALATRDRAPVAESAGLRVPRAALPILAMSALSVIGFPLDDAWHRVYGIDVTLWSPTHLLMIGGAILSTFGFAALAVEGGFRSGVGPRWLGPLLAAAPLLGLSCLQLEFDFGVPQWQAAFSPLLVGLTGALCLVGTRAWLGPWSALWAAAAAAACWLLLELLVGPGLGLTAPRFPIYLGAAVAVEVAYRIPRLRDGSPLWLGIGAGAMAAVVGVLLEWPWNATTAYVPWNPVLLAGAWPLLAGGAAAGVVGLAGGAILAGTPAPGGRAVLAAVLLIAITVGLLVPRTAPAATLTLNAVPVGAPSPVVDRFGRPSQVQRVLVTVTCHPTDACAGAAWFAVVAWQGGGRQAARLVLSDRGEYSAQGSVPTGGSWKTIVLLDRGAVVAAAPLSLPDDLEYGTAGVPLLPTRTVGLVPAPQLLETESHGGPPVVAGAAVAALLAVLVTWLWLLASAYAEVRRLTVASAPDS